MIALYYTTRHVVTGGDLITIYDGSGKPKPISAYF